MIREKRIRKALRRMTAKLTAPRRATPAALIVGAQRCGTTSLFGFMHKHPRIVPPTVKEVHFFDTYFAKGLDWYRGHFPLKIELVFKQAITLEATPYYIFHPRALQRIKLMLPGARIIVLLRSPIDRAISHYFHAVRWGQETLPILDAFAQEEARLEGELEKLHADETYQSFAHRQFSYKSRGVYVDQIERCFEVFGREGVHIIQSEVMFKSPRSVLDEVYGFLGLPPFSPEVFVRKGRPGGYTKDDVPDEVYRSLRDYFEPHNQRLYELLGREFGW
jgi:hypothetical protein